MTNRYALLVSAIVFAGCSFIDDFGHFTTGPQADAGGTDAGRFDGGRVDAGNTDGGGTDAGMADGGPADAGDLCPSSCDPACSGSDVCLADPSGCHSCQPCACDLATCARGGCAIVAGACGCAGGSVEGAPCTTSTDCAAGLDCAGGVCSGRSCISNADCAGDYNVCFHSHCVSFSGAEWQSCRSDGTCDPGLICNDGLCAHPCSDSANCTDAAYPECYSLMGEPSVCWPQRNCDFVHSTSSCTDGLVCRVLAFDSSVEAGCLRPYDTLPPGASCPAFNTCVQGAVCAALSTTDPSMTQCYQWCYVDEPGICPTGVCMAIPDPSGGSVMYMGRQVGICF